GRRSLKMKVICKHSDLTQELALKFGAETSARPRFQLTIGHVYAVVSVTPMPVNPVYGSCSLFDVIDDAGRLCPAPAYLFAIEDGRPSRHWMAVYRNGFIAFCPPDMASEYFADDLSEGNLDALTKWDEIKLKFRSEI